MPAINVTFIGDSQHGKTALVRAMTGIDTDWQAAAKTSVNLIDVPGDSSRQPEFLVGLIHADMIVLVIALDLGPSLQIKQQIELCRLLPLQAVAVVMTRSDRLDPATCERMRSEVITFLAESPFEHAPIFECNPDDKGSLASFHEWLKGLEEQPAQDQSRARLPFRMPIDHVFDEEDGTWTLSGILSEGRLSVGAKARLQPAGIEVEVKELSCYRNQVTTVSYGERIAARIACANDKKDLNAHAWQGMSLVAPELSKIVEQCYLRHHQQAASHSTVKHNATVLLHHGRTVCRARVLCKGFNETDAIQPGENSYIQLKFSSPMFLRPNDLLILTSIRPTEILGGGRVIVAGDAWGADFHADALGVLEFEPLVKRVHFLLQAKKALGASCKQVAEFLQEPAADVQKIIRAGVNAGSLWEVVAADSTFYITDEAYHQLRGRVFDMLQAQDCLQSAKNFNQQIIAKRLGKSVRPELLEQLLSEMAARGHLA